jgi:hypothetical protein
VIYLDKTTSATVTLPVTTADTISVGATDGYNRILFFKNINTGVWALTPASGTIEGASSYSVAQNQAVIIGASVSTGAGWHVLASFGIPTSSGPGSGDVVGPSGATSGDLALFDGSTGKLIKDGSIDTDLKFTGTVLSTQAGIRMVQIDLNNAQIKALPGTPFQLIAAPGANYRVKLIAVSSALDVTAATYSGLDTTYADCGLVTVSAAAGRFLAQGPVNDNTTTIPVTDLTKWLGGSVHNSVMDFVVPATSPVDAASSGVLEWNLPWPPLSQSFTDARDSPVFLSIDNNGNTADLGGGNAANFLRMTLYYAIEFVTT